MVPPTSGASLPAAAHRAGWRSWRSTLWEPVGAAVVKALPLGEQNAVPPGDGQFEAFGDPGGAFGEMVSRRNITQLSRRLLEQGEPAVEVGGVDRQRQVFGHRLAVIATGHQGHRRPERAHAPKMRFPVSDPRLEDRAELRVAAHLVVEPPHKSLD